MVSDFASVFSFCSFVVVLLFEICRSDLVHEIHNPVGFTVQPRRRLCRVSLQRVRQNTCQQSRLTFGQSLRRLAEIVLRGSLDAIDAVPELDDIEINLHYSFLAPKGFNQYGLVCFQSLSYIISSVPEKDILCGLLAYCACSARSSAASLGVFPCTLYLFEVETLMMSETIVFRRHYGFHHVGRNVLYIDPRFLQPYFTIIIKGLLNTSLNHKKRNRRIYHDVKSGQKNASADIH